MGTFWKAFLKLEKVDLRLPEIPMDCHHPSSVFYRLRKIKLDANRSDFDVQLQLIQLCPNLEDLFWEVNEEAGVLDEFAKDIEHGLWPKLEAIDLRHYPPLQYSYSCESEGMSGSSKSIYPRDTLLLPTP
ncbi:hypothetical protein BGX21_011190 [Mortierella sp. AD011]|nr:hypothetical protein BGX21_011190 [Mortierella sp. AD011]